MALTSFGTWGGQKKGVYTPGMGYSEFDPHVYYDNRGEKVIQSSGVLRVGKMTPNGIEGGKLHPAYAAAPGTPIFDLIQKQKAGFPLTEDERERIRQFWASNPTAGLPGVGDLGGKRGAATGGNGILTNGSI